MTDPLAVSEEWDPPAHGEAREVAEGVLWIRLPLPMPALDHVNIYALEEPDGWTLIDTGIGWAPCRKALARARAGALAGRPILRAVLTHHHPDHIGLAGGLAAEGTEILASRTAWLMGRMLTLDEQARPTDRQIAFRRRAGMDDAGLDAYATERPFNFADVVCPMPLGFRALEEGDVLEAGGRRWSVRLGEGHAPAHVTLWSEDGLLLSGDQVLPGISSNIGVYPTEPEADPLAGWLATCRRFLTHVCATGADPLVLPGHKRPFVGLAHRLGQLVENHEHALERIELALAERELTALDLFDAIYKRRIGPGETGLALAEAVAHVNHLTRAGRIARRLDDRGAWLYRPVRH